MNMIKRTVADRPALAGPRIRVRGFCREECIALHTVRLRHETAPLAAAEKELPVSLVARRPVSGPLPVASNTYG